MNSPVFFCSCNSAEDKIKVETLLLAGEGKTGLETKNPNLTW